MAVLLGQIRRAIWVGLMWAAASCWGAATVDSPTVSPATIPVSTPSTITVTAAIPDASYIVGSAILQRLDSLGRVLVTLGTLQDDGLNGDAVAGDKIYTLRFAFTEFSSGPVSLRVSAGFRGLLNRVFSSIMTVNVIGQGPAKVIIQSPANLSYLNLSPVTVSGTVDDASATVTVNELPAPVTGGRFTAVLPLAEGPNFITATAKTAVGASTSTITVNLDTTPPRVTIVSPADKFVTTEASIGVSGNVNDIVVGTVNNQQVQVTVNGVAAQVANRTFLVPSVPLSLGDNTIQAVGRDRSGNSFTTQITVRRDPPAQSRIRVLSGNNQSGPIGSLLASPLVVALTDGAGNPIANKSVIFKVTQNNGLVSAGGTPAVSLVAQTNAQGQAQVRWTLGMRSGAGGNIVEAYAVGFSGTALFTATGTQGTQAKIVIDSGNSQIGVVSQPLPKPLIAVVVDAGNNRLANVPVTFIAKEGGGGFGANQSFTVNTDSDGRAAATPSLGFQEGNENNLFEANFALNQGFPASFRASGRAPGNPANTKISGVVLDNSNVPIPGVTIRAVLSNILTQNSSIVANAITVQTNAQGQFSIQPAPVGFVKLLVDGSTAQRSGKYPNLDYDMVTIAGQNNTVGMPIFLLPINTANQLCVTPTTGGGTLTVPDAPGFSLKFGPGQVTFPGGSKEGCVSVTVVHPDKVPMVPGFGQQPRFIVTIQPAGALFNPPAPITMPNVDGLKPGEVTEMYSFDHDIGSFVAIGTGAVSRDGQIIASAVGAGVLKAGWHCGGNPQSSGTAAGCPQCETSQSNTCIPVTCPPSDSDSCTADKCVGGSCINGQDTLANRLSVNFRIAFQVGLFNDVNRMRAECPNRVPRTGHVPGFNGCGSAGLIDPVPDCLNLGWVDDIWPLLSKIPSYAQMSKQVLDARCPASVRQAPIQICFSAACNNHDICYDTCDKGKNSHKNICDANLRTQAYQICKDVAGPQGLEKECQSCADTYFDAVVFLGQSAFDDAQKKACQCCSDQP